MKSSFAPCCAIICLIFMSLSLQEVSGQGEYADSEHDIPAHRLYCRWSKCKSILTKEAKCPAGNGLDRMREDDCENNMARFRCCSRKPKPLNAGGGGGDGGGEADQPSGAPPRPRPTKRPNPGCWKGFSWFCSRSGDAAGGDAAGGDGGARDPTYGKVGPPGTYNSPGGGENDDAGEADHAAAAPPRPRPPKTPKPRYCWKGFSFFCSRSGDAAGGDAAGGDGGGGGGGDGPSEGDDPTFGKAGGPPGTSPKRRGGGIGLPGVGGGGKSRCASGCFVAKPDDPSCYRATYD